MSAIAEKIAGGQVGGRLWFYSNYHCNLRCTYCLTDSAPGVSRRELGRDGIVRRAMQAADVGFTGFGVTGGEPFLLDYMPELLAALGSELPTVVLSNGTTFNRTRLEEMEPLADLPVHVQISLDRPDPDQNDEMRGPANFRTVVEAVPKLVERAGRRRPARARAHADRRRSLLQSRGADRHRRTAGRRSDGVANHRTRP